MSVNFTPEMKGYSGQGAFRFWCQAILPLVYDDSLSYMELLNKMVIYLNNTISDVAAMEDNVEALYNAFNELQACYNELEKFVNDYFDNLDVQEEINNKLDAMVIDGTMDDLIEPFVVARIGTEVSSWLNEYVDPVGSAVIVDSSLSISSAAADAKVVGDFKKQAVRSLTNSEITAFETALMNSYNESTGEFDYSLFPFGTYFSERGSGGTGISIASFFPALADKLSGVTYYVWSYKSRYYNDAGIVYVSRGSGLEEYIGSFSSTHPQGTWHDIGYGHVIALENTFNDIMQPLTTAELNSLTDIREMTYPRYAFMLGSKLESITSNVTLPSTFEINTETAYMVQHYKTLGNNYEMFVIMSVSGTQTIYGRVYPSNDEKLYTWYDRSYVVITDILSGVLTRMSSDEISNMTDIRDMPLNKYCYVIGSKLVSITSNVTLPDTVTINPSAGYKIEHSVSIASGYETYYISGVSGNIIIYGSVSTSGGTKTYRWYDRSYADKITALEEKTDNFEEVLPYNILEGHYRTPIDQTTAQIHYKLVDGKYYVWGTASGESACVIVSGMDIPDGTKPGDSLTVVYETTSPNVQLRIASSLTGTTTQYYFFTKNSIYRMPDGRDRMGVALYVKAGTVVAADEEHAVVISKAELLNTQTNVGLADKDNFIDTEKPVYVAIGASTTIGAVHYYTSTSRDVTKYTQFTFPNYLGEVLGLDSHNLAVGGTGLMQRTMDYHLQNYMDVIYTNDTLLSQAKFITMNIAWGNDATVKDDTYDPPLYFSLGEYDDYYPYDKDGYHPSDEDGGMQEMMRLGATWCGCLNWCIKWLGDHYPKAQLVILFGGFGSNHSKTAVLNNESNPTKVIFNNTLSETPETLAKNVCSAYGIPFISLYDTLPYTYYGAEAKDENGDYVLFSTVKNAQDNKIWNSHPNENGYKLMAKFIAGKIANYFIK